MERHPGRSVRILRRGGLASASKTFVCLKLALVQVSWRSQLRRMARHCSEELRKLSRWMRSWTTDRTFHIAVHWQRTATFPRVVPIWALMRCRLLVSNSRMSVSLQNWSHLYVRPCAAERPSNGAVEVVIGRGILSPFLCMTSSWPGAL